MSKLSPMMERYLEVKRQNPGSILLFRMGDFYELFYDDAQSAARVLGLTLTSRDKASSNPIPMAGFPWHQLDSYLQKLIRAGYRAAICEQVEDPKKAKGLVKREVTRVVTPGTITDEELLEPRTSNFLACVVPGRNTMGLAWLELSTGRFITGEVEPQHLGDELARLRAAECLIPEHSENAGPGHAVPDDNGMLLTQRPPWSFSRDQTRRVLLEHFGTSTLEGFDLDESSAAVTAAGALLEYVQETQKSSLGHITRLQSWRRGSSLIIDEATRYSLELTQTMRDGRRDGSLLAVIDETVTSMGSRLLAEWLSNPLTAIQKINRRLDAVEEFSRETVLIRDVRDQLQQTYDLQRLTSRVATGRCSPRDLGFLARTLALLPKLKAKLAARRSELLQQLEARIDLCPDVRTDVEAALVDEPPLQTADGGLIRAGFHQPLDELRDLARGGKEWIAQYQTQEVERTGIPSLKIGFNKVFGYYLEVTAAHKHKVPDDYIRKQTLKNQERFVTPQLKQHEDKVLRAEEQANSLELQLFGDLRVRVAATVPRLKLTAEALAQLDVLAGLATLSISAGYCRPELTDEPLLDIREGRHPVLDRLQPTGRFVPNDVRLGQSPEDDQSASAGGRVQIITGPNMAGKSTYIRQAALITVMAQMGSFVPASEARIGVADRVFARVGASDELGRGQSTFMVEMTQAARILNSATRRSLVILDEIGRGTSTYDGISLAWAITEHLHDVVECRTMFATHYHELTELPQTLNDAANWNVEVREQDDDVIFVHRIVQGAADKSYGIHVARLAGVPPSVIDRAERILDTLEQDHLDDARRPKLPEREVPPGAGSQQLSLFAPEEHPVLDEIRRMEVDRMTPLAALQELHRIREQLQ